MKKEEFLNCYADYELRSITITHYDNDKYSFKCNIGEKRVTKLSIEEYKTLSSSELAAKVISDYAKNNTNIKKKKVPSLHTANEMSTVEYSALNGSKLRVISKRMMPITIEESSKKDQNDMIKHYRDMIENGDIKNISVIAAEQNHFKYEKFPDKSTQNNCDAGNKLTIFVKDNDNKKDNTSEKIKELVDFYLKINKEYIYNYFQTVSKQGESEFIIELIDGSLVAIKSNYITEELKETIEKTRKRIIRKRMERCLS